MRRSRALLPLALVPALVVGIATPAGACAGLIGPSGSVELLRTSTLAAHADGVEHYVTSFEFAGGGAELGSIVPLPDVPTEVVRGGDWTLQRLAREVAPQGEDEAEEADFVSAAAPASAEVLLETTIDALDITVLRGGGDEVGRWAEENGFSLTPDAPEVLDFYAERSPIFMAARFDATAARERGQGIGQGTPVHLTIPTDDPWVPLRILGLGRGRTEVVEADVFLLTEDRPELRTAGPGLVLDRSEPASASLLTDLRTDVGMGWVPEEMWFSHLQLDVAADDLDYDLAIGTGGRPAGRRDAGLPAAGSPAADLLAADSSVPDRSFDTPAWPLFVTLGGLGLLAVVVPVAVRRRSR